MKEIEVNKKKPSEQLMSMIKDFGQTVGNLKNLAQKINEKGYEEGLSDFEIVLLAREVLRHSVTGRQLHYWFPIRSNWTKMEESSGLNVPKVNNDSKKGMEESHIAPELKASIVLLQSLNTISEKKDTIGDARTIELKAKTPRLISYSDLVDPKSIDCTNHPMYQKAHENIRQLKQALVEKKDKTKQPKEALEDRSLCLAAKKEPASTDFFHIAKDCDFSNEHFKGRIEPTNAIQYLQQFVGRYRRIDFGFREVE